MIKSKKRELQESTFVTTFSQDQLTVFISLVSASTEIVNSIYDANYLILVYDSININLTSDKIKTIVAANYY